MAPKTKRRPTLALSVKNGIATLRLDRPDKRNAVNDEMVADILAFFSEPPANVRAVVVHGAGEHFSAGLDLSEHRERQAFEVMQHSQLWHKAFDRLQFGGLPVIAALHGAVIGGGLELAAATHVRIAEPSAFYALPEGERGIFVGGGASVRVARLIGQGRMVEMMLTGRRYDSKEGQALGLSHYLVGPGEALPFAQKLAARVAANAPLSNYAILNGLARIENMAMTEGLFAESLLAALAQTSDEATRRMQAFFASRKRNKPETKSGKKPRRRKS